MNKSIVALVFSIFVFGCANLSIGGSKEPIKMDISMRLDVYQHVEKDISAIEDLVSGTSSSGTIKENQSFLNILVSSAYAESNLSPEVEQAALRRRDRLNQLYSLEAKGVVGENKMGLVEIRNDAMADNAVKALVSEENNDRMIIYKEVSSKNQTAIDEVQKLYAKRLQADAPSGTPIEVMNESTGSYQWMIK